jgi:catechol 2,3-dioxygenase-like lactoylglutathione lyase family enzyme
MTTRLEALELFVDDLERSVGFYVEHVGAVHGHACHNGYVLRLDDDFAIRLRRASLDAVEECFGGEGGGRVLGRPPRGQGAVLSLLVEDLAERFAAARARGVPLFPEGLSEPARLANGTLTFTLVDPDGYLIRMVEVAPSTLRARSPEERAPTLLTGLPEAEA